MLSVTKNHETGEIAIKAEGALEDLAYDDLVSVGVFVQTNIFKGILDNIHTEENANDSEVFSEAYEKTLKVMSDVYTQIEVNSLNYILGNIPEDRKLEIANAISHVYERSIND